MLVDVDHSMAATKIFGWRLRPAVKVSSVEEAVRLANDSPYGLSAAVFLRDLERARKVALQLDCGGSEHQRRDLQPDVHHRADGRLEDLGIGARFGGPEGLRKYCRIETVVSPRTNVWRGQLLNNSAPRAQAGKRSR